MFLIFSIYQLFNKYGYSCLLYFYYVGANINTVLFRNFKNNFTTYSAMVECTWKCLCYAIKRTSDHWGNNARPVKKNARIHEFTFLNWKISRRTFLYCEVTWWSKKNYSNFHCVLNRKPAKRRQFPTYSRKRIRKRVNKIYK